MQPAALILAVLLATGCTASSTGGPDTAEPTAQPSSAEEVPWSNYSADVRGRIDAALAAKDCPALQTEFDRADQNSDAQRSRTGTSNAKLMEYLDRGMRAAGCY